MKTKTNRTIKKIFSIALCLALVMSYVPMVSITASAAATDTTVTIDTGTSVTLRDADSNGYYEIGTADELYAFAAAVNDGNYAINGELTADITVNENVLTSDGGLNGNVSNFREWTPIGNGDNNYAGIFEGNRNTVSGLYFNDDTVDYVGLFGAIGRAGKVQNVGVIDSYFNAEAYVGGVVGYNKGTMTNCYNTGTVICAVRFVGGMAGYNYNTITNCYNIGSVSGNYNVGGVAGYSCNYCTVTNCYNTGFVSGSYRVGGVIGRNNSTVTNCYNTGSVSGNYNIGGILGENDTYGAVMNSYYLNGCATDGNNVTQFGVGNETAGSTTADVTGQTDSKPADWFASGEVCTAVGYHVGASAANGFCDLCIYDPATMNADGYYEISNGGQLFWFGNYINTVDRTANAVLTADIDLEGRALSPIGKAANKYAGVFDGQGHTISNFHIHITSVGNWGLFGYVAGEGTVIKNFSINGDVTTALTSNVDVQYGVVGQADGGAEIRNVHSSVNLTSGDSYQKKYFGGIVGRTGNITVDMCSYSGKLSLGSNTLDCVGGIVGYVYNGKTAKINNCGFYGDIDTTYSGGNVGGILGYYNGENAKALTISNCLSVGTLPEGRGAIVGTLKNYGSTNAGSNNYYLDGLAHSVTNITANSASQKGLENGRIAYYLQSNNTEQVWGQDIDNGKPRQYVPTINAGKLYKVPVCGGDTGYSNSSETNGHNYIDYKCVFCGMYTQPPKGDIYYLISNIGHLLWWQQAINEAGANEMYVKLVADIDLNPGYVFNEDGTVLYNGEPVTSGWYEWTPMGTEEETSGGEFFGNNHTISGIYINSDIDYAGFFGVTYNANIKDFNISNAYIKGKTSAGGLCGKAMYSKITNCVSNATVSAENNAGGICGEIKQTNFYQCGNNGNIDGYYAGGICGYEPMGEPGKVYFGYMENCYNTGDITGESYAGGLFGSRIDTQCYNCFNIGKVTSDANAHDISTFHFNNKNSYYLSETETEDGGKTVEQFASGEVAYLLQQGNTEQVWGQMSNTEGSLPIITDNELYKVVTVGETGNYSVANVGDTNGDGTVDVNDYQVLVNAILNEDPEQEAVKQIETASYDDIVKYDLDGDGYLDVVDVSLLERMINGDKAVDVYAVGDFNRNGKAFEEADSDAIKQAVKNPSSLSTAEKYACDINADGKVSEEDLIVLTAIYGKIDS
ncbi:MAG: hypothetical protein E7533_04785 [Ruminococcaceae bacterium]|nr:hypothetical protein [Oscillospiraceae bacterium]